MYDSYLYHFGVKGMRWGVRKTRKWATSQHQPSSARSSTLAGLYAATGNKKVAKALDKSNTKDAEDWKRAKEDYKKITSTKSSKVTDRVLQDYGSMTNREFKNKYQTSKKTYAKRVEKYGDPYMYRTTGKKLIGDAYEKNKSKLVTEIKTNTTSYNNGKNVVEEYLQTNKGRTFTYAKYDGYEFDDVEYAHYLAKNGERGY